MTTKPARRHPSQTDPPRLRRQDLPTMYDLPSEAPGEPGLPDEFHAYQPNLLRETFRPGACPPEQVFVASDLNLYYDLTHPLWYKRPDWFAVLGVSRLYEGRELRLSYVIWQERVTPYLVVELLSPGTEDDDLGRMAQAGAAQAGEPPGKWEVYERILGIPYYVVFGRELAEPRCFRLAGGRYREIAPAEGRLWLPEAGIGLAVWLGAYRGVSRRWLRCYDVEGNWIPTPEETGEQERRRAEQERRRAEQERRRAEQERRRAEQEHQRAEQERQRADRLAAQLKALGIDPEQ